MPPDELQSHVEALRECAPRRIRLLEDYYPEFKTALGRTTRSYPTSSQLYTELEDPSISAHTFGRVLPLLVECAIINTNTERSNSNRYDLREYDPQQLEALGDVLTKTRE
ncbi:hypothetical protein SAMN04487948_11764 [Halogranum amylolyticum]|uniref:Uncharacterized protein n=1 Tax=Halogranum amylolyticum TaxID=660520 RepID=A0A1H8VK68_9EURY|nr:hypothetical protein SAMN04487948_11764 [Halogranum amylolyticum]